MTPDTSAKALRQMLYQARYCSSLGEADWKEFSDIVETLLAERDAMERRAHTHEAANIKIIAERDRLAEVVRALDAAHAQAAREVERLRKALRPFARINDEYEASNLDEHRPEWPSRDPGEVDLLVGRGGKRLLTLADCMTAYDALAGEGHGDG